MLYVLEILIFLKCLNMLNVGLYIDLYDIYKVLIVFYRDFEIWIVIKLFGICNFLVRDCRLI